MFACRAFVNFNGVPLAGTYSRTGTTVTVTMTAHGMTTGQAVVTRITSGSASGGTYAITVVDANTFTYTDTVSGSTSGNLFRDVWLRNWGNVGFMARNGTGDYTITFFTALPSADYAALRSVDIDGVTNGTAVFVSEVLSATTTAIRVTAASGGNLFDVARFDLAVFA